MYKNLFRRLSKAVEYWLRLRTVQAVVLRVATHRCIVTPVGETRYLRL